MLLGTPAAPEPATPKLLLLRTDPGEGILDFAFISQFFKPVLTKSLR
jgi:hypothetical protein